MISFRKTLAKQNFFTTSEGKEEFMKKAIANAMKHKDILGAGAKKRKALKNPKDKIETVMKEFKRGTLNSGSGEKVSNPKQAIAIGLSEARKGGAKIPMKKKDARY